MVESQDVNQNLTEPIVKVKTRVKTYKLIPITIDEEQHENEIPQPIAILDVPPELPQREVKVMQLVKCEKCNRRMLEQTIKYKHQESCPGNKHKIKFTKRKNNLKRYLIMLF